VPVGPGYQVAFAERIRRDAAIATAAVGMINDAELANDVIESGKADLVLMARELLRDPYWPAHAAKVLERKEAVPAPNQYARAW
jgi:2,4-dienoyl-CoA reductase-like NADH-dependent reductase (Old Yellow Enzyme family)